MHNQHFWKIAEHFVQWSILLIFYNTIVFRNYKWPVSILGIKVFYRWPLVFSHFSSPDWSDGNSINPSMQCEVIHEFRVASSCGPGNRDG